MPTGHDVHQRRLPPSDCSTTRSKSYSAWPKETGLRQWFWTELRVPARNPPSADTDGNQLHQDDDTATTASTAAAKGMQIRSSAQLYLRGRRDTGRWRMQENVGVIFAPAFVCCDVSEEVSQGSQR